MPERADPNPVLDHILAELVGASRVLDVGCGTGGLARALVRRGFTLCGVDPQAVMIESARQACPEARFVQAGAEALPFPDAQFDAAIFLNSLHHVPPGLMDSALSGVARRIRPAGCLIVVEPLAEGPLFEVVRAIDDETEIRRLAQEALDRCGLRQRRDITFERRDRYADAEAFIRKIAAAEPARAAAIDASRDAFLSTLSRHADRDGAGLSLTQPMRLRSFVV